MLKEKSGMTLIELMIAMLLGLVILGTVYALFTMQQKQFSVQGQITDMRQSARIAMNMMIRDISMAGYRQTSSACTSPATAVPFCTGTGTAANLPCVGIINAGTERISFTADLNANCSTAASAANPDENITYDLYTSDGVSALTRTSNGDRQPVAEYVDALSFAYYDGVGNIMGPGSVNVAQIRKIRISITVRTAVKDPYYTHPTFRDHYRRYRLESFAIPRNLGTFTTAAVASPACGFPIDPFLT